MTRPRLWHMKQPGAIASGLLIMGLFSNNVSKEKVMLTLAHMHGSPTGRYRISSNLVIVVLFALLVALIPNVPQLEAAPRAQPELIALVQQQPQAIISVIVQKNLAGTNVEQRVSQLGGTITLDLHIINAFAARLAGQAALILARMD